MDKRDEREVLSMTWLRDESSPRIDRALSLSLSLMGKLYQKKKKGEVIPHSRAVCRKSIKLVDWSFRLCFTHD